MAMTFPTKLGKNRPHTNVQQITAPNPEVEKSRHGYTQIRWLLLFRTPPMPHASCSSCPEPPPWQTWWASTTLMGNL